VLAGVVAFAVFGASSVAQLLLHGLRDRQAIGIGLLALPLGCSRWSSARWRCSCRRGRRRARAGAGLHGRSGGHQPFGARRLAPAGKRAETFSSHFVLSTVAVSGPVIGVGFAAQSFGL